MQFNTMMIFVVVVVSGLAWLLGISMRTMMVNALKSLHKPDAAMSRAALVTSAAKPVGALEPATTAKNESRSRSASEKPTSRPVRIIVAVSAPRTNLLMSKESSSVSCKGRTPY